VNKVLPYALTAIGAVIVLRWVGVPLPAFLSRITGPATTIGFFVAAWPQIRRVIG
jgi:hypothetical protein